MKTRQCDECKHFNHDHMDGEDLCERGHRPRFYTPRRILDFAYGYKRKCADFKELENES